MAALNSASFRKLSQLAGALSLAADCCPTIPPEIIDRIQHAERWLSIPYLRNVAGILEPHLQELGAVIGEPYIRETWPHNIRECVQVLLIQFESSATIPEGAVAPLDALRLAAERHADELDAGLSLPASGRIEVDTSVPLTARPRKIRDGKELLLKAILQKFHFENDGATTDTNPLAVKDVVTRVKNGAAAPPRGWSKSEVSKLFKTIFSDGGHKQYAHLLAHDTGKLWTLLNSK